MTSIPDRVEFGVDAPRRKAVTLVNPASERADRCEVQFMAAPGAPVYAVRFGLDDVPVDSVAPVPGPERILLLEGAFDPGQDVRVLLAYAGSPPSPARVRWFAGDRELVSAKDDASEPTIPVDRPEFAEASAVFAAIRAAMVDPKRRESVDRMRDLLLARLDKRWLVHDWIGRAPVAGELPKPNRQWVQDVLPAIERPFELLTTVTLADAVDWYARGWLTERGNTGRPDSAHFCMFAEFAFVVIESMQGGWDDHLPAFVRAAGVYFDHFSAGPVQSTKVPADMSFDDWGGTLRPVPRRRDRPSLHPYPIDELAALFGQELLSACPRGILVPPRWA